MSNMHKAQSRRAAQRKNHRVRQPIQAHVARRQRLIYRVACVEISRFVLAAIPGHLPLLGRRAIGLPHAAALPPAKLLHRQVGHILVRKAHLVHLAHHLDVLAVAAGQLRLPYQHLRMVRKRPSARIIPHALLANPDNGHARIPDQFHGAVRNGGAWPKQQYRDCGGRNIYRACLVAHGYGAVVTV